MVDNVVDISVSLSNIRYYDHPFLNKNDICERTKKNESLSVSLTLMLSLQENGNIDFHPVVGNLNKR